MNRPIKVVCFFEDIAHERFIRALIERAAQESNVSVDISVLNATHGSKVWLELRKYLRDLTNELQPMPDVLVVVIDGNCRTAAQVRREIEQEVQNRNLSGPHLVCAVPDPHIERWYLEDQQAFKSVVPESQPKKLKHKCERDRYKKALLQAFESASVMPVLGGAEYGEEIAQKIDPSRMDDSFKEFWKELLRAFREGVG